MSQRAFDLNCDLGEGEPLERTKQLMECITSVNIACGIHAGNVNTIRNTLRLAKEYGVNAGAHPGLPGEFGRALKHIDPEEFELLLLQQIGAFELITNKEQVISTHIKLHGTLYHLTEHDEALREKYLTTVKQYWPEKILFALAGGKVERDAKLEKLQVWAEGFLDRSYQSNGSLLPREHPNAMLESETEWMNRLKQFSEGKIISWDGCEIKLNCQTLCLHGDFSYSTIFAKFAIEEGRKIGMRFKG